MGENFQRPSQLVLFCGAKQLFDREVGAIWYRHFFCKRGSPKIENHLLLGTQWEDTLWRNLTLNVKLVKNGMFLC